MFTSTSAANRMSTAAACPWAAASMSAVLPVTMLFTFKLGTSRRSVCTTTGVRSLQAQPSNACGERLAGMSRTTVPHLLFLVHGFAYWRSFGGLPQSNTSAKKASWPPIAAKITTSCPCRFNARGFAP